MAPHAHATKHGSRTRRARETHDARFLKLPLVVRPRAGVVVQYVVEWLRAPPGPQPTLRPQPQGAGRRAAVRHVQRTLPLGLVESWRGTLDVPIPMSSQTGDARSGLGFPQDRYRRSRHTFLPALRP